MGRTQAIERGLMVDEGGRQVSSLAFRVVPWRGAAWVVVMVDGVPLGISVGGDVAEGALLGPGNWREYVDGLRRGGSGVFLLDHSISDSGGGLYADVEFVDHRVTWKKLGLVVEGRSYPCGGRWSFAMDAYSRAIRELECGLRQAMRWSFPRALVDFRGELNFGLYHSGVAGIVFFPGLAIAFGAQFAALPDYILDIGIGLILLAIFDVIRSTMNLGDRVNWTPAGRDDWERGFGFRGGGFNAPP